MAEKVNAYNLAEGGVQLVKSDRHMTDNELRQGQNAIFGDDEGGGGIESRPGMAVFNAEAMSGAVKGFINVDLIETAFSGGGSVDPENAVPVEQVGSIVEGGGVDVTIVGGGTSADVTSDASDLTYIEFEGGTPGEIGRVELRFTNPLEDPGVYVGWVLRIRARTATSPPSSTCIFRLRAGTTTAQVFQEGVDFTLTGSFANHDCPITDPAAFVGNGGLADPRVRIETQYGGPGESMDVAELILMIPGN